MRVARFYANYPPPHPTRPPTPHPRLRQIREFRATPDLTRELHSSGMRNAGSHPESSRTDCAVPDLTRGAPKWNVQWRTSPGNSRAECVAPDLIRQKKCPIFFFQKNDKNMSKKIFQDISIEMSDNIAEKNINKNIRRYVRRNVKNMSIEFSEDISIEISENISEKNVRKNVRRYFKEILKNISIEIWNNISEKKIRSFVR